MNDSTYIGIDLGTSAVKLLLMTADGTVLNTVSKEYPIDYPQPGWSEQNPEDWYRQTLLGLHELLRGQDAGKVAGLSAAGQMHSLVVLDENDNILRPAILWNDTRTRQQTDYLNTVIGQNRLSSLTANIAFAGFTAPKLLWIKEHEPQTFKRIAKVMLPKDYIVYRLTGMHATDPSDASGTLLYDVKNKRWSSEMLRICGISEKMMPTLYESCRSVGFVKADIARELKLSSRVIVAAGAGDNAAAAVGTGTVGKGNCNLSIGTSGTVFVSDTEFCCDGANAMHSFAHADGGFHLLGCVLSAAACNQWWLQEILGIADYAAAESAVNEEDLGENDVYFLPYLSGERSPHNDSSARGAFIGLTAQTTKSQMTQAVMEGVAFAIRDSFEAAKAAGFVITASRICGGGAKSALWCKIFANVLGIELQMTECEEGPSFGAAMLAAVACGTFDDAQQAVRALVRVKSALLPEEELMRKYEGRYQNFRLLYPALKAVFPQIH